MSTDPVSDTSPVTVPEGPRSRGGRWGRVAALQRRLPLLQAVALVALFEWGTWTVTDFATRQSVISMLISASFLGLAGAGQTLVVLVGGIDFSVPAIISGASIAVSELCGTHHWPFLVALVAIGVVAVFVGAVNGYVSHRFNVQPLVVTLGVGSIVTGAALVWTKGAATGLPPAFLSGFASAGGHTFGIAVPAVVFIWAAVAVILGLGLARTVAGRRLYATGSNPVAAHLALIRTRRVWVVTFAASALISAAVGILLAGYAGAGNITLGDPYLFEGLAAVIVGGTAFGARGDYLRTVLGALTLTVLTTVLVGKGYTAGDQQMILGVLILVVVTGYARETRLRDRI